MSAEWYYTSGGRQFGPITALELKTAADSGRLRPNDHVRKEGAAEWRLAQDVKGLLSAVGRPIPPPPPIRIPPSAVPNAPPGLQPTAHLLGAAPGALTPRHSSASGAGDSNTPVAFSPFTEAVGSGAAPAARRSRHGGVWLACGAVAAAVACVVFLLTTSGAQPRPRKANRPAAGERPSLVVVENSDTTESDKAVKSEAELVVSAKELYAAYRRDPQAADVRFKGKRFAVSGAIGVRDDAPRNHPRSILIGLSGSDVEDEFVACYMVWENERLFYRLDGDSPPPIIGTCLGAGTSEYGKKGARPMEVQLVECIVPEAPGEQSHSYKQGFADGQKTAEIIRRQLAAIPGDEDTLAWAKRERRECERIYKMFSEYVTMRGCLPSKVEWAKGRLHGFRSGMGESEFDQGL